MKIIFFGLGSIGRRHVRLLQAHFKHELYAFRSGESAQPSIEGVREISTWKEVSQIKPDVAFITNPTYQHIATALKCAQAGMHLFIEKPIDCTDKQLTRLIAIVERKRLTAYVAYFLRFHPMIEDLKRALSDAKNVQLHVTATSFMPEWRSGRDYSKVYSAQKRQGGGVVLDLSHEIDYVDYLIGVESIEGRAGRLSQLKTDCEDFADILTKSRRGNALIHLNYNSRKIQRTISVQLTNGDCWEADLIKNELTKFQKGKNVTKKYTVSYDDAFVRQLKYFFQHIHDQKIMNNLKGASVLFRKILAFKKKYGQKN